MNLDLLTAVTRRLDDTLAEIKLSGKNRTTTTRHNWSLLGRWHRQSSDWLAPAPVTTSPQRRRNLTVGAAHRGDFFADQLATHVRFETTTHDSSQSTEDATRSVSAEVGATWTFNETWAVFAEGARSLHAPWTGTGRWQQLSGKWLQEAPGRETRNNFRTGFSFKALSDLSGQIGLYHESAADVSYRDWQWAAALGERTFALDRLGALRSVTSTSRWTREEREGWSGSLHYSPSRTWETKLGWFSDWKNQGPYRGGDRRAVFSSRYEFRSGALTGFAARATLAYRAATTFDDAYVLSGGTKLDITLSYRMPASGYRETVLQLNWSNLTGRPWQPTRFAPERGREFLLSATQRF